MPPLISTPGKYLTITPAQYFNEICPSPAFTNSLVRVLLDETPMDAAYLHPAIGAPADEIETTAAKRRGDVAHQIALGKGRGYAVGEFKTWGHKGASEFKQEAEDRGLTPIKRAEYDDANAMAKIIKQMIETTLGDIAEARGLPRTQEYETEVVFACTLEIPVDGQPVTIWARIMVDVWCEALGIALDPKCTAYLTNKRAPAHIDNMGWHTQAALYKRVIETVFPKMAGRTEFVDLMVKPKPPYTSRAVAIPESWLTTANMDIDVAMGIFARCIRNGEWPGYAPGIHYMQQPSWAQKLSLERQEEMEGDGHVSE